MIPGGGLLPPSDVRLVVVPLAAGGQCDALDEDDQDIDTSADGPENRIYIAQGVSLGLFVLLA